MMPGFFRCHRRAGFPVGDIESTNFVPDSNILTQVLSDTSGAETLG